MQLEARLRAFAAVARQGSFSRAAADLFISQPAVSKHVASLEAALGKRLLEREASGATLTASGRMLAEYVLRAEALLANAGRALASVDEADVGAVKIAASGIPGDYLLPPVLARFLEQHPRVELSLRVGTSAEALQLVRAHSVDLAIVGGFSAPNDLETEQLVDDEIVLVGPSGLGSRRMRTRELERPVWISREEGSATRAAVDAARWQLGLHEVRTLELTSWEAVKATVAAGGGIAAISRFAIQREVDGGILDILDVPGWRLQRTISIVTARDVPLTPAARRFRDAVREREPTPARPTQRSEAATPTGDALAVFESGFDLEAAEQVCGVGAETLARLADEGALVRDGSRFLTAPARRRAARRRFAAARDADKIRRNHAEFFAALVEDSDSRLTGSGLDEWSQRLLQERPNIDAAARWAGERGEHELQLKLLAPGWRLWLAQGYPSEWRRWLEQALDEIAEPSLRLLALPTLGWVSFNEREFGRAKALGQERLELGRELGDQTAVAGGLTLLASVAEAEGDVDTALRLTHEAVSVNRAARDDKRLAQHLGNLAGLLISAGRLDEAGAAAQEATSLSRANGDEASVASGRFLSALVAHLEGRSAHALELVKGSVAPFELIRPELHWGLVELAGAAAVAVGHIEEGVALLAAGERVRRTAGEVRPPVHEALRTQAIDAAKAALGDNPFARAQKKGARMTAEQALELAQSV